MIEQITCGIKISVETNFKEIFYKGNKLNYVFGYKITIKNKSKDSVQLNSRHWIILEALNNKKFITGDGVVGQRPVIYPNKAYTYNSGCVLKSSFGSMTGYYSMINFVTLETFNVTIPAFKLCVPFVLN